MEELAKQTASQEQLLRESIKQSTGSGLYHTNVIKTSTPPVYPWAPTVRLQTQGGSIVDNKNLIDVDSEMMNITRINSLDPEKQYIPTDEESVSYRSFKDGFFHEESTRLTNPTMELRDLTKNNFTPLFFDPQENVIEPDWIGKRTGVDTYLSLIDDYQDCAPPPTM